MLQTPDVERYFTLRKGVCSDRRTIVAAGAPNIPLGPSFMPPEFDRCLL
jgi:hypothetical protein